MTSARSIAKGLRFLDSLSKTECNAFLALFAGARFPWTTFNNKVPFIGKAECERVDDWRDFYAVRLANAGLFYFNEDPPQPALGMVEGSTYTKIDCGPTELGFQVREAWWTRWQKKVEESNP